MSRILFGGGGAIPACIAGGIPACLAAGLRRVCSRGSAPGGACSQGVCSGGCLVETPPDGYCCGRYASYWNALLSSNDLKDQYQWRIQDFPEEGAPTPRGGAPTYDFAKFSQKLHEIERIWTPRGGARVQNFTM